MSRHRQTIARFRRSGAAKALAVFPAVVLIGVVAAGCGSSGSASGSSSRQQGFAAFAQCMRAHGVESFGPGSGGGGAQPTQAQSAAIQQARAACASAGGGAGGFGGANNPQFQAVLAKYDQCMKANGYDMPAPGSGSGFGAVDRSSPAFEKANAACRSILQGAFGGHAYGAGTTTGASAD